MGRPTQFRIGVLGPQASGKTIFLACLFDTLRRHAVWGDFLIEDRHTQEYIKAVTAALGKGELPQGTSSPHDLYVECHPADDAPGVRASFHFKDYRGGLFQERHAWAETDPAAPESGFTILELLTFSDGILLLIDTEALMEERATHDEDHYLDSLITIRRQRRGARLPIHVLFTKSDLYPHVSLEDLQARVWKLVQRSLASRAAELPESVFTQWKDRRSLTSFFKVSCLPIRPMAGGRFRLDTPRRSGQSVFQPDNVIESFQLLVDQIRAVRRRTLVARTTTVAMSSILVAGGISAPAVHVERTDFDRTLAAIDQSADYLAAKEAADAYVARWNGWRLWPLLGLAQERLSQLETRSAELASLAREQVLQRALRAIGEEPDDEVLQSHAYYEARIADIQTYIDGYDANHPALTRALRAHEEKRRYLDALEELNALSGSALVEAIDRVLGERSLPTFGDRLRQVRDTQGTELAWLASYQSLASSLPGMRGQTRQIEQSIEQMTKWLAAHRTARPGHEFIARVSATMRAYQLVLIQRAFDAVAEEHSQNPGLSPPTQRNNWSQFLTVYEANRITPDTSAEGTRWNAIVGDARERVDELARRIAREDAAAADAVRRQEVAQMDRALSELRNGVSRLDDGGLRALRAFISQFGADPEGGPRLEEARRHWERLAVREVREPLQRFVQNRDRSQLARIRDAQRSFDSQSTEFRPTPEGASFVKAAGSYAAWAAAPVRLHFEVNQVGRVYMEVYAAGRRVGSTVRRSGNIPLTIEGVSAFATVVVRLRSSDGFSDTTMKSRAINLLNESGFSDSATHRGQTISVTFRSERPQLPPGL